MHTQKSDNYMEPSKYSALPEYARWASIKGLEILIEYAKEYGWSCCFCIQHECIGHAHDNDLNTAIHGAFVEAKKDPRLI